MCRVQEVKILCSTVMFSMCNGNRKRSENQCSYKHIPFVKDDGVYAGLKSPTTPFHIRHSELGNVSEVIKFVAFNNHMVMEHASLHITGCMWVT